LALAMVEAPKFIGDFDEWNRESMEASHET
jgi:hypothetical protein